MAPAHAPDRPSGGAHGVVPAASSDVSASLAGGVGSLLQSLQVATGHLALEQRQYDAESDWQKDHHLILSAIATVAGIAAMIASAGTAAPAVVAGLTAVSVAATGVGMGYDIAEHNTAGAIEDGAFIVLPVIVNGVVTFMRFAASDLPAIEDAALAQAEAEARTQLPDTSAAAHPDWPLITDGSHVDPATSPAAPPSLTISSPSSAPST